MQKTKLGLSAGILGAIAFLVAAFGGYIPALLIAGYVLIAEDNTWLKKTAVKAVLILLAFSTVSWIVSLIPSLLSIITDFLQLFKVSFYPNVLHTLFSILQSVLTILRGILLVFLAIPASQEKTLVLPGVDPLLHKLFG